ncbi:hypothetical protein [Nitrospira sp. M1]
MKVHVSIFIVLSCIVAWNVALAEPVTALCEAVKEKAWKAEQIVAERQRVLQIAQGKTRLAQAELVECRPGAVFSVGRAQRCAQAQSDVPLHVKLQLEVEQQLDNALADLHVKNQWVDQECRADELNGKAQDFLVRLSALEDELMVLKTLLEQLERP